MTIAKCTEEGSCAPRFDLDICGGFGDGPYISFSLPDECWPESDYDGAGVFTVDLKEILEEAINGVIEFDSGESAGEITALLREYADRIDAEAEKHRDKWGS